MVCDYSNLRGRALDWALQAHSQQWISQQTRLALETCEALSQAPPAPHRPLFVAFMGGTGVGKSSLLNRLAGRPIAKSGIARPTSREVTVFYHRDIDLPELPLQGVTLAPHDDAAQKRMVWIDMPDFDSTDAANKALVLQWLPHIDVLLYVVSPERYRDEKAWQLLLAQGTRHAWVFVMNQWDMGLPAQADDFVHQLALAGFEAPLIFKTSCTQALDEDEFALLTHTLHELATQKTGEQLYYHSQKARINALKRQLEKALAEVGEMTVSDALPVHWTKHHHVFAKQLRQGVAWKFPALTAQFAAQASEVQATSVELNLWDAWAQSRFDDVLNETVLYARHKQLPSGPLDFQLRAVRANARKILHDAVEWEIREALAKRGTWLARALLKAVGAAEVILPLAAMGWVGYQVVDGYYQSNQTHLHYLSVDFAVHSVLVMGLSWLVPFFILKKCQPSLEKSALRGINKGITRGLSALNMAVMSAMSAFFTQQQQQHKALTQFVSDCDALSAQPLSVEANSPLARMLIFERE
ncbi:MAG TPA: GTP-binding protein [Methylococcaceae bacterium]|nr:GTP-binding protein [Methylococcaceae bacterium]